MNKIPKNYRIGKNYLKTLTDYFGDLGVYNPAYGIAEGIGYLNLISAIAPMFKPLMTFDDVDYVVYWAVTKVEAERVVGSKLDGNELLCREIAQEVLGAVVAALQSYPRDYIFQLNLTGFTKLPAGKYQLHDDMWLEFTPDLEDRAQLSIVKRGFWRPGQENELVENFLKKSKIFAYLMHSGPMTWHPIKTRNATASIKDTHTMEVTALNLPDGMAQLMGGASINVVSLLTSAGFGPSRAEDFVAAMEIQAAKLRKYFDALELPGNRRIATAIEWYEDARAVSNQTVALLELCIGLEALLGDEESMPEMTNRLCDRFAFTLGKTPADRKILFTQYKELLGHRGKLVHAKVAKLDAKGSDSLQLGYGMLHRLISHELQLSMT